MTTSPAANRPAQASFGDIVQLLPELPNLPSATGTETGWAEATAWVARAQHRAEAQLVRPKLALFCASHGAPIDSAALLAPWQDGSAPLLQAAARQDMEVQLFDLTAASVANNGPALTEAMAANAMVYGLTVASQGFDLLALTTIADQATGADSAADAVIAALLKQDAQLPAAKERIAANRASLTDPLTIAATLGGHEICAMIGAILAARMAKMPVIIDDLPAIAAALTLAKLAGPQAAGESLLAHVRAVRLPSYLSNVGLKELPDTADIVTSVAALQTA